MTKKYVYPPSLSDCHETLVDSRQDAEGRSENITCCVSMLVPTYPMKLLLAWNDNSHQMILALNNIPQ